MTQKVVQLTFHGPMTPELAKIDLPGTFLDYETFIGRGRHRLEATMNAITCMKRSCRPEAKPYVQTYANHTLAMVRQDNNDPMRIEGAEDNSTHMYAAIHLSPPGYPRLIQPAQTSDDETETPTT